MHTTIYLSPDGNDKNSGTIENPVRTADAISWPAEGAVALVLEPGHAVGDLAVPVRVERVAIYAGKRKHIVGEQVVKDPETGKPKTIQVDVWRCDAWTKKKLDKDLPTVGKLTCTSEIVCHNIHFLRSPDVTLEGVEGAKETEHELKHAAFVHCVCDEDFDFRNCKAAMCVCRRCTARKMLLQGFQAPGRVHLQEHDQSGDVEVDDKTDVEFIAGSTQKNRSHPDYGKRVDTCRYRGIVDTSAKGVPAKFLERKKEAGRGSGDPKAQVT
jgi:hypothetical protein